MAMVNSGEGTTVMEAAKAFRPRILAERERIEAGRRLPEDLARALAHAGFFRIFLPVAYGGLDLTPMAAL
jgi:indole-3-acetate monooxygenase